MRIKIIFIAVVAGLFVTLGAASPAVAMAINPGTTANLLDAMHGEGLAFAKYNAFADEADRAGQAAVAALFRSTADQERDEHFVEEAVFTDLVGSQAASLRGSIAAEAYEATTLYPGYARQARHDGDQVAAGLFQELAADEATHRALLRRALQALCGDSRYPASPSVDVVAIVAGPARSSGTTLDNVNAALRGEAFASAKYHLFAAQAADSGNAALSELFAVLSDFERLDHFASLANLAGLVGTTAANLTAAIAGENFETTTMYPNYANAANAVGDTAVGARFLDIAGDEAVHRDAYAAARAAL